MSVTETLSVAVGVPWLRDVFRRDVYAEARRVMGA